VLLDDPGSRLKSTMTTGSPFICWKRGQGCSNKRLKTTAPHRTITEKRRSTRIICWTIYTGNYSHGRRRSYFIDVSLSIYIYKLYTYLSMYIVGLDTRHYTHSIYYALYIRCMLIMCSMRGVRALVSWYKEQTAVRRAEICHQWPSPTQHWPYRTSL
jgi:hypothetical protein